MVSFTSRPYYFSTHWTRGWVSLQGRSGCCGVEKAPCPYRKSNPGPPAPSPLFYRWAIPTMKSTLIIKLFTMRYFRPLASSFLSSHVHFGTVLLGQRKIPSIRHAHMKRKCRSQFKSTWIPTLVSRRTSEKKNGSSDFRVNLWSGSVPPLPRVVFFLYGA